MPLPLDRLKQYLLQVDEVQILELLDLSTEDIVNAFEERIIKRRKYLEKEVEAIGEDFIEHDFDEDYDASN